MGNLKSVVRIHFRPKPWSLLVSRFFGIIYPAEHRSRQIAFWADCLRSRRTNGTLEQSRSTYSRYIEGTHCLPGQPRRHKGEKPINISENQCGQQNFQVMPESCRRFSRYDRQEFHLMTESTIKHTKFSRTFGKGNVVLTYIPERGSKPLPRYLVLNQLRTEFHAMYQVDKARF